jgi:transglutaminase-like putative cysteine protease
MVVAGWMLGAAPAGAANGVPKATPAAKAAPAKVRQPAAARETDQRNILERIAAGRDAASAIAGYRKAYGDSASPSVDRGAERRQLQEAEQALHGALLPLQKLNSASAAQLAPAWQASQAWRAAVLVHDGHQQAIEARLAKADGGAAYLGKFRTIAGQRKTQQEQLGKLIDAIVGTEPAAPQEARAIGPATVKAALAMLDAKRARPAPEPVLRALGLPVGGLNLATRAPVRTPLLTPSYATTGETPAAPADSAGAPEAPLSDDIVKQASALGNDYVRIYEFVRNQHRTEWYPGSVRGAVGTLRGGVGNDVDQASLLVALLRAAGVPARYVHGVVELDVDKVAADLGLADAALVPAALTKAGVAYAPIARGGKIAAVQVEHVWVTALVPYTNYRGASVDASGKTWIPLDASFKDSIWTAATVSMADAGSPAALQAEYLGQQRIESFALFVEHRATDAMQRRDGPYAKFADALGKQETAQMNLSLLPNTLPYPVLAVTAESAALPAADLVQARLTLRNGSNTVLDLQVPVHEVVNQRLTLSYQPATLEDQRLSLSFGGLDAVPLYLISLRPQWNLGGKPRLLGSDAVAPGANLTLEVTLSGPFGSQRVNQSVMAGAYQAVHIGGAAATRPA